MEGRHLFLKEVERRERKNLQNSGKRGSFGSWERVDHVRDP